jgi:hypothetical protein
MREQCISQPGTPTQLEALSGRVMFRLPYRNFGTHETLVTNLTVDADGAGRAGIRFVELRKTGAGTWALQQEGTYSPDGDHRWMGSIAIDRAGNVALGYSVSSSSTFPGIRYVGRLATDPLGTLPQGETTLIAGGGSQTGSNRWGDYSAMSVDPVDDCTFWYTQQYYATTSSNGWRTRIGSFRFPSCSVTPTATPTPTPTRTPTATPLPTCTPRPNVSVAVAPGGGGLQVTITAAATANARLLALQFGPASNGLIDVPGGPTGSTGSFTFNPPIETQQVVFSVRRATAGQATTVPLTVVDSCGSWPTFVGGGTSAGF